MPVITSADKPGHIDFPVSLAHASMLPMSPVADRRLCMLGNLVGQRENQDESEEPAEWRLRVPQCSVFET